MHNEFEELQKKLRAFSAERDWAKFHSPKNLACALSVEAAELLEHFQWMSEVESDNISAEKRAEVEQELADVFCYLLLLTDRLAIDPINAAAKKIELNRQRYPVALAKGKSTKYTELKQKTKNPKASK
jgi:NTP pyrophosphatase (non-canonical NTP hydrolase)